MARVLGGLDRDTRARAVRALGAGGGGRSGEVLARVLGLEVPARRDRALALLGDPAVADRVELVEALLAGDPGAAVLPLARRIHAGPGLDDGGSLGGALEAWLDPAASAGLAGALADETAFPARPGESAPLLRLAWLAGLLSGRAGEIAAAARCMLDDPDPRRASAAGELIESGVAFPGLRARLLRELRAGRTAPRHGPPPSDAARP
jgi:hypothetical protein